MALPITLTEALAGAASAIPDIEAHRDLATGRFITYRQWADSSSDVAHGLIDRGICRDSRVGLVFTSREFCDFAVSLFGVLKAGAIPCLVSASASRSEVLDIVTRYRIAGCIVGAGVQLTGHQVPVVWRLADLSPLSWSGALPYRPPHAIAAVIQTSGTTFAPKGVAIPDANLLHGRVWSDSDWRARSLSGSYLHMADPATNYGFGAVIQGLVASRDSQLPLNRRSAVAVGDFSPRAVVDAIQATKPTAMCLVPTVMRALIEADELRPSDTSSIRILSLIGSLVTRSLARATVQAFPQTLVLTRYGSTESAPESTCVVGAAGPEGIIGWPGLGSRYAVVSTEGGSAGEGEIALLNAHGRPARWYLDDPASTAKRFSSGWIRMGDVGRIADDGSLLLIDRLSDRVNRGGRKVSTVEVEAALQVHPAVQEIAIYGIPDDLLGQELAAAVVLREGTELSLPELRQFGRGRLSAWKLPRYLEVLSALPRNSMGKVVKAALPHPSREGVAKQSSVADSIKRCWTRLLGTPVRPGDFDFFDQGGDSLLAMEMVACIEKSAGIRLDPADVYRNPRIDDLVLVANHVVGEVRDHTIVDE